MARVKSRTILNVNYSKKLIEEAGRRRGTHEREEMHVSVKSQRRGC